MLTDDLYCNPRVRKFDEPFSISLLDAKAVPFGINDTLEDAQRRLGIIAADDVETTSCSPVIPTAELTSVRPETALF